ncbi:hypothetical protein CRH02_04655 [Escherichia albertii]|nr:hypothetical protein CRH02_04655 [Escherichia albertii]
MPVAADFYRQVHWLLLTKNNILPYSATFVCGIDGIFNPVGEFNLKLPFCDTRRVFTLREYSQSEFTMILMLTI